ncbi:MAG TPA: PPOX class F420-dependent oxidoreductase [Streptosporangiaceae bacterium]
MDAERAAAFLRANHRAVLATARADGRPQLSPVTVTADDDGRVLISTRETAVKFKNLARDPHASLCVLNDGFFGEWIQAEGSAEIIHLPEAMDLLVDYYRRISGEHPDWDEYRDAMRQQRRVIVRITITRAGPDTSG